MTQPQNKREWLAGEEAKVQQQIIKDRGISKGTAAHILSVLDQLDGKHEDDERSDTEGS